MPRLNLKDESLDDGGFQETGSGSSTPPLRDVGSGGGGGLSPIVLILLIIAVLGLGVFALNHFGVVHLWGKKAVQVAEAFPEPVLTDPGTTDPAAGDGTGDPGIPPPAEQTPQIAPPAGSSTPSHTAPAPPPSGTGEYTIQVSSWTSQPKAESEAARLATAGYSAFVEEGSVGGTMWYRVRVGRYATESEAKNAIAAMQPGMETDLWVARVGR